GRRGPMKSRARSARWPRSAHCPPSAASTRPQARSRSRVAVRPVLAGPPRWRRPCSTVRASRVRRSSESPGAILEVRAAHRHTHHTFEFSLVVSAFGCKRMPCRIAAPVYTAAKRSAWKDPQVRSGSRQHARHELIERHALLLRLAGQACVDGPRDAYYELAAVPIQRFGDGWLGNIPTGRFRSLEPGIDSALRLARCIGFRRSPGRTAGKIGRLGNEARIFFTPEDFQWVAGH